MKGDRIVLGAGLSGLSASYHLGGDVPVFERADRPGGLCRSVEKNGYVFDYGPHILFSADPYASQLIKDLLGDDLLIKDREAYIYHDRFKTFTRFPFQAHLYGLPVEVVRECLVELFEAYARPDSSPCKDYREWIIKTFGKGIADHLMFPYAEKLWTVPPEKMSFEWIGRRVPTPPISDIVTGALTDAKRRVGFNNSYWYPKYGGIEALVKALAGGVEEVRCKSEITRIDPGARTVEINGEERISYSRAISTLPLPALISLIEGVP
ncbi:protoporphyrinogen/coproporphyrinogen oxidase, partial [Acidobacteriota bacterium]